MWNPFGPHKVFAVLGFYKLIGRDVCCEKFLEVFADRRTASAFAAKARADGFEGTKFAYVEVRELEPKRV